MRCLHLSISISASTFDFHKVEIFGLRDGLIVDSGLPGSVIWRREARGALLPKHLKRLELGHARYLRVPRVHLSLGDLRCDALLMHTLNAIAEDFPIAIVPPAFIGDFLTHHSHVHGVSIAKSEVRVLDGPRISVDSTHADFCVSHRVIVPFIVQ